MGHDDEVLQQVLRLSCGLSSALKNGNLSRSRSILPCKVRNAYVQKFAFLEFYIIR